MECPRLRRHAHPNRRIPEQMIDKSLDSAIASNDEEYIMRKITAHPRRDVGLFSFRGLLSRNHESICVGRFGLSSGVAIVCSYLCESFGFQEILKLGKAEDSEFVYLRNLLVAAFGITKGEGKRVSPRIVMPIELVFAGSLNGNPVESRFRIRRRPVVAEDKREIRHIDEEATTRLEGLVYQAQRVGPLSRLQQIAKGAIDAGDQVKSVLGFQVVESSPNDRGLRERSGQLIGLRVELRIGFQANGGPAQTRKLLEHASRAASGVEDCGCPGYFVGRHEPEKKINNWPGIAGIKS